MRPVVTLAFYTGIRLAVICNLKWENVDLAEYAIRLNPGETKNDEPRIIPLSAEATEMPRMLRQKRGSVCVFGNGRPLWES